MRSLVLCVSIVRRRNAGSNVSGSTAVAIVSNVSRFNCVVKATYVVNVTRKAFLLDGRALAMARASSVLALRAETIGRAMSLPERLTATVATGTASPGRAVAVVAIDGPLAQRAEQHVCGVIDGYDAITARVSQALEDRDVGAVVLQINSPGGDVAGLEEAVRRMRAKADATGKRVVAFADEMAASAAYWIAAGVADEVWLPPMGEVGSIGTIGAWVDETEALAREGV